MNRPPRGESSVREPLALDSHRRDRGRQVRAWRIRRSTTARPLCARRPPRPSRMPKTLGLVADPVVVAETVERTGPDVAARLSGDWHVRTDEQTFAAGQELRELSRRAAALAGAHGWDAVIGLTDLPMVVDGETVLADVSPADRVAVLSVPALGPLMLKRRLRRAVVRVAEALEGGGDRRVIGIGGGGHLRLVFGMVAAN